MLSANVFSFYNIFMKADILILVKLILSIIYFINYGFVIVPNTSLPNPRSPIFFALHFPVYGVVYGAWVQT